MSDGDLITRADLLWDKAEIAARKYCGNHGYEQEPMKLTRIIFDLLCAETIAASMATRDALEIAHHDLSTSNT
jgi:hypothetical protein